MMIPSVHRSPTAVSHAFQPQSQGLENPVPQDAVHFSGKPKSTGPIRFSGSSDAWFNPLKKLFLELLDAPLAKRALKEADIERFNELKKRLDERDKNLNLRGINLSGKNLKWANLFKVDLTGANLTGANLMDTKLAWAKLEGANLTRTNLTRTNLSRASLTRAELAGANLEGANLSKADFTRAKLDGANFEGASLTRAELAGANLEGANLSRANLTDAKLAGADLTGANLTGADLTGADLTDTILDPVRPIPGLSRAQLIQAGFEVTEDNHVLGYHTKESQHIGDTIYKPGETYTAPWFSRDTSSDSHPGLYLFPRKADAQRAYPGNDLVQVKVPLGNPEASNILQAGGDFRTPSFEVVQDLPV